MPVLSIVGVFVVLPIFCAAAWFGLRAARRIPEPVCADCRYPTTDIARLICPECGADLRAVGILTPRIRARMVGGFWGVVVGWTLVVGFIALLAAALVGPFGPQVYRVECDAQFRQGAWPAPSTGYEIAIDETFEFDVPLWSRSPMTIYHAVRAMNAETRTSGIITVTAHGPSTRIVANVRRSGVDFGTGIVPFGKIDAAVVTNWLAEAGILKPASTEVDAIAFALARSNAEGVIEALSSQGIFARNGGGTSIGQYSAWEDAIRIVTGAVCLVVWIFGIVRLALLMRLPVSRVGNPA